MWNLHIGDFGGLPTAGSDWVRLNYHASYKYFREIRGIFLLHYKSLCWLFNHDVWCFCLSVLFILFTYIIFWILDLLKFNIVWIFFYARLSEPDFVFILQ